MTPHVPGFDFVYPAGADAEVLFRAFCSCGWDAVGPGTVSVTNAWHAHYAAETDRG